MSTKKIAARTLIFLLPALIAGFLVGVFLPKKYLEKWLPFNENDKIEVILDIINEDYVDPVNIRELTEKAIPRIIGELDPHSDYIPASDLITMKEDMDGYFGGIGIDPVLHLDTIVIVSVIHGGPSEQAGLLSGDRIISINDSVVAGIPMSEEKILSIFRGQVGTPISIGIKRGNSEEILEYTIIRGSIPLTTIKAAYEVAPGIGLIKIYDKFSHTTHNEFITAMAKLLNKGCHSFIIDLRMNKGGAFEAALNICNEFLPMGKKIVYAEGKSFPREDILANGLGTLQENQLVILIDQISASASEIVAGAIQDNDRGLIIGRKSFGKGLVQDQIELSDGSALRLTIARYFTPSGRNIQRAYEMGKSDQYNQEWLDQLMSGESFDKDAISLDSAQIFHTTGGRTVYGGGGIMPDIFVPVDTTELTSYYLNLENKGIFHQFAFDYSDQNRDTLRQMSSYSDMLTYLENQSILYQIVLYAQEKGIRRRSTLIQASAKKILNTTYANILQHFFGEEAFFEVYMKNDNMIEKAIEVIQNEDASPQAIREMRYLTY
jgi:C-terminal peptidase (prc)